MKLVKMAVWLLVANLVLTMGSMNVANAAVNEWITLPGMKDIESSKMFSVTFNKEVAVRDIDGIVIFQGGNFVPVEITVNGRQAFVKPSHQLLPNTSYEMRIFIGDKRYKMNFETIGSAESGGLIYEGKKDVKSYFANDQLIKGLNHYKVDLKEGHPINIYVTDDYEQRYGKGFAYDETVSMIKSIEAKRNEKPYTTQLGTLNIFFYTNESNTALPSDVQAQIGSPHGNNGKGSPTEMLMNGSTMPYDFRTSYVHEFIHYFDYQTAINESKNMRTFENYWGPQYRFWLLEGGAEYGGYFFYDYPENTKNRLTKYFVQPTKESILAYAKAQGGYKKNLLYNIELDSFDDIYKASSNNYGVSLSLFWYLSEQYGYDKIYEYTRFIAEFYEDKTTISQQEKDNTAKQFFGKSEKQVLIDWLTFFNYFDGELQEYKETTTGTANHIFQKGNSLVPSHMMDEFGIQKNGEYGFAVNIAEWVPGMGDGQALSFLEKSTTTFKLIAAGKEPILVKRTYSFYTGSLTNGEQLYAVQYIISASEQAKLVKGTTYSLQPINNDSTYKWVIPENLNFTW